MLLLIDILKIEELNSFGFVKSRRISSILFA